VGDAKTFDLQAKRTVRTYGQSVTDLDRLQDRLQKGQVNRENIAKELPPGGVEKPGVEKPKETGEE
jgi:hypothetical protein